MGSSLVSATLRAITADCGENNVISNSEVFRFSANSTLLAQDFRYKKLYLIEGTIEINRNDKVPQVHKASTQWNRSDPLFLNAEYGEYAHCVELCKILVISYPDNETRFTSAMHHVTPEITSEMSHANNDFILSDNDNKTNTKIDSLYVELKKFKDMNVYLSNILNTKSAQVDRLSVEQSKTNEICTQRYSNFKKLNHEFKNLLTSRISTEQKYQRLKKVHNRLQREVKLKSIHNAAVEQYKKSEHFVSKSVEHFIVRSVPLALRGVINFIQTNMAAATRTTQLLNEKNSRTISPQTQTPIEMMGQWYSMDAAMPYKNGLYYVSDGNNVAVSYFNKNKVRFHVNNDLEVRYWSVKNVTLAQ